VLDLLGKYSLVDGFLMIMLSVGFGFTIAVFTITVEVEVTNEWAVTGGMIASAWSAMQSHFLLLFHYRTLGHLDDDDDTRAGTKEATGGCRRPAYIFLTLCTAIATCVIGGWGATQHDVISYKYGGFAGQFIADEGPSLSLVELGMAFFRDNTANTSDQLGVWIVTLGYFGAQAPHSERDRHWLLSLGPVCALRTAVHSLLSTSAVHLSNVL
jgi:hypothetical protein